MFWFIVFCYTQLVIGTFLGCCYQNHINTYDRQIPWGWIIVFALIPFFTLPLALFSLDEHKD